MQLMSINLKKTVILETPDCLRLPFKSTVIMERIMCSFTSFMLNISLVHS